MSGSDDEENSTRDCDRHAVADRDIAHASGTERSEHFVLQGPSKSISGADVNVASDWNETDGLSGDHVERFSVM